jgi:hypothetical protein
MEKSFTLVYQEDRPIVLMEMKMYRCGMVHLAKKGQEFNVSERERNYLLKLKNGTENIYKEKEGD